MIRNGLWRTEICAGSESPRVAAAENRIDTGKSGIDPSRFPRHHFGEASWLSSAEGGWAGGKRFGCRNESSELGRKQFAECFCFCLIAGITVLLTGTAPVYPGSRVGYGGRECHLGWLSRKSANWKRRRLQAKSERARLLVINCDNVRYPCRGDGRYFGNQPRSSSKSALRPLGYPGR